MATTPILALLDFSKVFTVETDASQKGVGPVLMQQGRPISFLSKSLPPRKKGLPTYEKELGALFYAVHKWKTYLLGHPFIIKTNHQSLKYLFEQRVTSMLQHKWLTKLMGFDYSILYKRGVDNKVAKAFSRKDSDDTSLAEFNAISLV